MQHWPPSSQPPSPLLPSNSDKKVKASKTLKTCKAQVIVFASWKQSWPQKQGHPNRHVTAW